MHFALSALSDALSNISTRRARAASLMPCKTDRHGNPYIMLNGGTRSYVIPFFVVSVLVIIYMPWFVAESPELAYRLLVGCLVIFIGSSRFLLLKLTLTDSGLVYRGIIKKKFTYDELKEMARDDSMAYIIKPDIDNIDEFKAMTNEDLITYFAKPDKDDKDVEGLLYISNSIKIFFTLFHGSHDFAEQMQSKIGTTIEQTDKIPSAVIRSTLIPSLIAFIILLIVLLTLTTELFRG